MLKKSFLFLGLVVMSFVLTGCVINNDEQFDEPLIEFNDSVLLTEEMINTFFDEVNEAYVLEECDFSVELGSVVSREDLALMNQELCSVHSQDTEREQIVLSSTLSVYEALLVELVKSETRVYSSENLSDESDTFTMIDMGDASIKVTMYNIVNTKNNEVGTFSQITMAIIDGDLFVESYSKILNEGGMYTSSHFVFYENQYFYLDNLGPTTGRQYYQEDFQTSEFYGYAKAIDEYGVSITYGDETIRNDIAYNQSNEENYQVLRTYLYKDNIGYIGKSATYMDDEMSSNSLFVSLLELPGWDELRTTFLLNNIYSIYQENVQVYSDYSFTNTTWIYDEIFPMLILYDVDASSDSYDIDDYELDLSLINASFNDLESEYESKTSEFGVVIESQSYQEILEAYNDFEDLIDEYLSQE